MKRKTIFFYAFTAAFGALIVGLNMGGISGAIDIIEAEFSLNALTKGFVTGAIMVGCLFGALLEGGEDVLSIEAVNVRKVARVVGMTPQGEDLPNPNNTLKRFGMSSTDFGNMWDAGNGTVWAVFGDNFNNRGGDWLSNAVAITTDRNLEDGLYYDSMLWDDEKNKRKEIITSRQKTGQYEDGSFYEITCIPTGGFSVPVAGGNRQYINYMSIHNWKNNYWLCNYSEIVWSDDYGRT